MVTIPLFQTPNSLYAYDANYNEILALDQVDYDFLKNRHITDESVVPSKSMKELLEAGYFSEQLRVRKVMHSYTDFLEAFLNRKVGFLTLQVTQGCNFRCKYCVYSEDANQFKLQQRFPTIKSYMYFFRIH